MNQNSPDNYSQQLQDYFQSRIRQYDDTLSSTDMYIAYTHVRYVVNMIMGAENNIYLPKGSKKVSGEVFELSKGILDRFLPERCEKTGETV